MKIAYLNVTSWVGRLAYAEHFYGRLTYERQDEEVLHTITAEEAERLNGDKLCDERDYEEGSECSRFFTHEGVVKAALEQWQTHWPDAEVLLLGEPCVLDPTEVLAGPDSFMTEGNEIVKLCYSTGYYDADELTAEHKELRQRWRNLLEPTSVNTGRRKASFRSKGN